MNGTHPGSKHTLAQRRTFLDSARAANGGRLRVRTHFDMRAIRGPCPTQSRHLAFIYEQQSLHAVFFFVLCPRGKGLPTVDSSGTAINATQK